MVTVIGDRPWNAPDSTVSDPDGDLLTFTKGPINKALRMTDMMQRTAAVW